MAFRVPSSEEIITELNLDDYLSRSPELPGIITNIKNVLDSMEKDPYNYRLHMEEVYEFLRVLWGKYDCEEIYDVLRDLTNIEPALLDLERNQESGSRYRDHFVHVFHVFVCGLRILSGIIKLLGEDKSIEVLKVRDENIGGRISGVDSSGKETIFPDYTWKERLFYLWTIMSTLHDIAIPITHLSKIREALNKFSERFNLSISGPDLVRSFPPDLNNYLCLVSNIYEGKLEPDSDSGWLYNKPNINTYMKGYLERSILNNHGILGGYLVYKMVEGIFLQGKSQKYKLTGSSYQQYHTLILNEDIARATLGICLHDLNFPGTEYRPDFIPINFSDLPLTFILIISDSLQEYLRWESLSIRGNTKLTGFPQIEVRSNKPNNIVVYYAFSIDEDAPRQKYFCDEICRMAKFKGREFSSTTINDCAKEFCNIISEDMQKKIQFQDNFQFNISFYISDECIATKKLGI